MSTQRPPAKRALDIFDDALELLDTRLGTKGEATLPSKPLPSLLDRCEDILRKAAASGKGLRLVSAFPGVAPEQTSWWKQNFASASPINCNAGTGGLFSNSAALEDVRETTQREVLAQTLSNLNAKQAEAGLQAVFLLSPSGLLPASVPEDRGICLFCHPMLAYGAYLAEGAPGARSLDRFCAELAEGLERLTQAGFLLCPADKQGDTPDLVNQISAHLGLKPLDISAALPHLPRSKAHSKKVLLPEQSTAQAAHSYVLLCAELGYDPADYPGLLGEEPLGNTVASRFEQVSHVPAASGLAIVSSFLERAVVAYQSYAAPSEPRPDIQQIKELMDNSLAEGIGGFFDRFDAHTAHLPDRSAALLRLAGAAHFTALGERLHALSFVAEGLALVPPNAQWIRKLAAAVLIDNNATTEAFRLLIDQEHMTPLLNANGQKHFEAALKNADLLPVSSHEHGHSLLIKHLNAFPPVPKEGRKPLLIEIGTTRETVPGQGSTEKLAQLCVALDMAFVTVDMDPRNSRSANQMFLRKNFPFEAVTSRGEDFLAAYDGEIDYIFIDAYDFDHGNHSELRQSRYEQHLGNRIDEELCHKMHLDCAESLVEKLAPDGLICFDDTWKDAEGRWTAKGTTAMPFLLENGFEVLLAENRAALLARKRQD